MKEVSRELAHIRHRYSEPHGIKNPQKDVEGKEVKVLGGLQRDNRTAILDLSKNSLEGKRLLNNDGKRY